MQIVRPIEKAGAKIHVHGKSQGFIGLPVRHDVQEIALADSSYMSHVKTTAWHPTPDELAALNAGAAIYVDICAENVYPMKLYVGEVPAD